MIPPERDRGDLGIVTRLAERRDQSVRVGLGTARHERRLRMADQDPHAAFLATSAKSWPFPSASGFIEMISTSSNPANPAITFRVSGLAGHV